PRDPAAADFPAVGGDDHLATGVHAAVIAEIEDDTGLAGLQRRARRNGRLVALLLRGRHQRDRPAVLEVEAPSAEAAAERDERPVGRLGGKLDIGGDTERAAQKRRGVHRWNTDAR